MKDLRSRSTQTIVALVSALLLAACTSSQHTSTNAPTSATPPSPPDTSRCAEFNNPACYTPEQLRRAYDLDPLYRKNLDGQGVTIAILVLYGSPTIQQDLADFDSAFHIAAPPSLRIISPNGPVPSFDPQNPELVDWARETSLSIELAHAMAPGAGLLVVQAPPPDSAPTEQQGAPQVASAERYVIEQGLAQIITQPFAYPENTISESALRDGLDNVFVDAKDHHVTMVSGSGDYGATAMRDDGKGFYTYRVANWPASDPLVTAVGGTTLDLNDLGQRITPDVVWNNHGDPATPNAVGASGGGLSRLFERPSYQTSEQGVVGSSRGLPDISLSAAVDGGALVYEGFLGRDSGWFIGNGTSVAVPLFAGIAAIADQAAGHPLGLLNPSLYRLAARHAPGIVDITSGSNSVVFKQEGRLRRVEGWDAVRGYDLSSGLGTVDAARLVPELARSSVP